MKLKSLTLFTGVLMLLVMTTVAQPQSATLPVFITSAGKSIPACKQAYTSLGRLNADRSNAILIPTWFGGKSRELIGIASGMIDTTKYFVILADALGNGISSSPSNTPNFPDITIHDMVVAEHELITKTLGIRHLFAVMGFSMGGMQTFEWLASYPDFMDKALPVVGTPIQSGQDALLWETEWNIIDQAGKDTVARRKALASVSSLHAMNLFTPAYWAVKEKPGNIAALIKKDGENMVNSTNPENWICQIKAMLKQDIYSSSGKSPADFKSLIKARILVVAATQDHMVNPLSSIEFAKLNGTELLELTGDCGHMASTCESEKLTAAAKAFLFN